MTFHSPETIAFLVYGFCCFALVFSAPPASSARERLNARNLRLCGLHGLLQGAAGLFCRHSLAGEWVHGVVAVAASYLFYLFGWLSLRDFGIGRCRNWSLLVALGPWLGLPLVVGATDPLGTLHDFAAYGLVAPGAGMAAVVFIGAFARAHGPTPRPVSFRVAVLAIAVALAAFGLLSLAEAWPGTAPGGRLFCTGGADSAAETLATVRGLCLLAATAGVVLLFRQVNREMRAREQAADTQLAARSAELAALNSTLEDRVRARTQELLQANTELEAEIARHRRTEAELLESSTRLQTLFDQPAMGVTFLDHDGHYLRVNGRFAELVGRHPADLVGRTFADISEREEVAKDMVLWNETLAGQRHFFAREKSYVRPDGVRIWVNVTIVVVREPRQGISLLLGLYEDIGERRRTAEALRENERRLQLALSASQQSLFEYTVPARRFRFAPDYVERLGHRADSFPAEPERWAETLHPEDRAAALGALQACLADRAPAIACEFRQQAAAGGWRWIQARGSVVERDGAGLPHRLLGTFTDVTERRTFDERLRRTQRLESIGALAGGIAHDLNNALVPLLAGVSFLREYVPAEEADLVAAMETSSRRAASMVQQLLVFARGAEGRRTPVQPAALVEEMRQFVESTFPPSLQFHANCLCKAAVISGDPTQLHQVLLNLCVNARDAMPRGGSLGLEARLVDVDPALAAGYDGARAGPHVQFVVSDTGTGIPVAIRERIFDPFFTTKGPEKGTGLGLSTVLGIVRGHGGFVELQTEEGKGTRFLVHLPVAGDGAAAAAAGEAPPALPDGRGRRLLIVDDEEVVRTLIERVFEGSGFEIVSACDGIEGLAWTNTPGERVDLMLLDMTMPNLGGLEVLRRLRASGRMVPTVVLSGNFDREQQAILRELGLPSLAKPFQRDDLVRAVRRVLQLDP